MKLFFQTMHSKGVALLVLRIAVGAAFLAHGIGKLASMDMTVGFFNQMGMGAFWAWLVAIVETVGGLAMVLGVFTTIAGLLLMVIMVVAIITVKSKMGVFAAEIDFMLFMSSLAIVLGGPGKWAVGNLLCPCDCGVCKDGTCSAMMGKCVCKHSSSNGSASMV